MTNAGMSSKASKERNFAGRLGRPFWAMESTRPRAPKKIGTARK